MGRTHRWHARTVAVALIALGTVAAAGDQASHLEDRQGATAGMRIHRDPTTGEIGTPPPGTVFEEPAPQAERAGVPAAPVPGRSSAGGEVIDVRGLPKPSFVVAPDRTGTVMVECVPGAPAGKD